MSSLGGGGFGAPGNGNGGPSNSGGGGAPACCLRCGRVTGEGRGKCKRTSWWNCDWICRICGTRDHVGQQCPGPQQSSASTRSTQTPAAGSWNSRPQSLVPQPSGASEDLLRMMLQAPMEIPGGISRMLLGIDQARNSTSTGPPGHGLGSSRHAPRGRGRGFGTPSATPPTGPSGHGGFGMPPAPTPAGPRNSGKPVPPTPGGGGGGSLGPKSSGVEKSSSTTSGPATAEKHKSKTQRRKSRRGSLVGKGS